MPPPLIFTNIGKNAGTALRRGFAESAIRPLQIRILDHGDPLIAPLDAFPERSLCICLRDPITRYLSGWRSRYERGFPDHWEPQKGWRFGLEKIFRHYDTPEKYFRAIMQGQTEAWLPNHFRPQAEVLGGLAHVEQHLDRFNFILQFEHLAEHWQLLHARYDLPAPELPLLHNADHGRPYPPDLTRCPPDYRELSPEVLAYMRQTYADDYRLIDLLRGHFPHLAAEPPEW